MLLRDYLRLTGMGMVYTFATALTLPVLGPYFRSRGFSDSTVGIVFAIFPLVIILASLGVPFVSRKLGRFYTMLLALLFSIIAYWLYVFGTDFSIVSARVLDAVCYVTMSVLLLSKVEDKLENSNRGRFGGVLMSLEYLAKLAAPVIGGALADRYLALPFVASIILFIALGFMLRNSRIHEPTAPVQSPFSSLRWFVNKKELQPMVVLGPALNASGAVVVAFLPLMIVAEFGLTYVSAGAAIAVYGVPHVLQFLFGDISDRYGRRGFLIAGCSIFAIMLIAVGAVADSYSTLLVLVALMGVGAAICNVIAWSHLFDVAAAEHQETEVVASYYSTAKIGDLAGLLLAAAIVSTVGYRGVFIAVGFLTLFGVFAAALMFLHEARLEVRNRALTQRAQ